MANEAPYRPSIFLCCILIFWSGACIMVECFFPKLAFVFSLTIYGPTIYLAVRSIVQTARESHTGTQDTAITTRRAITLLCLWCLPTGTHLFLWWNFRTGLLNLFLLPVYPATIVTVAVIYLVTRLLLRERAQRQHGSIVLPNDEESGSSES